MESNIPTVKEFLQQEQYYAVTSGDEYEIQKAMIEFARLHCEAQEKAILKKACTITTDSITNKEYRNGVPLGYDVYEAVDKESILNAYPLDLIK